MTAADPSVIGKTCPYCLTPFKPGAAVVSCLRCGMPHHRDCWQENGGCTTFGCLRQEAAAAPGTDARGEPDIDLAAIFAAEDRGQRNHSNLPVQAYRLDDAIPLGVVLFFIGGLILPYLALSSGYIARQTIASGGSALMASFWRHGAPASLVLLAVACFLTGVLILCGVRALRIAGVVLLCLSIGACLLPALGLLR